MGYSRVLGSSSRSARGTIKMPEDVVILGGARTPMAEYVGSLKDLSALELGGPAAGAALARGVVKDEIVPGEVARGRKTLRVGADAHLRPETSLEGLAALKP